MTCKSCAERRAAIVAVVKRTVARVASIAAPPPVVKHSIKREDGRNGR